MSQMDAVTGAVLEMLTRALAAQRVLEIGTGTGMTALSIARALPGDGMLITLERDEARALRARANLERAGVGQRVSVMIGEATRCLHKISGPFDLVVLNVGSDHRDVLRPRLLQLLRDGGLVATQIETADGEIALMVKR